MNRERDENSPQGTYWLVGVEGKARRVRLPITAPLLVGRGASNHIVLDDPRISRQHARFAPERDGAVLYDLNSANGTVVNGVTITKHKLQPEDVIRFGRYAFKIEEHALIEGAPDPDVETPTLVATESVARMIIARESTGSGDRQLVDLTQLEDAYQKLGTLYGFMKSISVTLDKGELLRLIGTKIREVFSAAHSVAVFLRVGSARGSAGFQRAHFAGAGILGGELMLPEEVAQEILASANALLAGDAPESSRVPGGTDMFAPMVDRGEVLGVIHVSSDENRPSFTAADLELLNSMAATAAMTLQTTKMHDETILRDRLKYDLELAAKIQKSFLPREVISVEGLEIFAEYRAAYTIGGDFYDVFWVGEDKLAIFIGDISGKGVAAALLMARISSELRVAALAHVEPVLVLSSMNESILASGQPELFFTAIYLTFNVKTGEIILANAGHCSPYWCRPGMPVEPITAGAGTPIGILEDPGFTATSIQFGHGDSLVLYTDGVVEAADSQGHLYGVDRLEACLADVPSTRPNEIAEKILRSVEEYAIDTAVSDDLTLFICHRAVGHPASMQPRRRSGQQPAHSTPIQGPQRT